MATFSLRSNINTIKTGMTENGLPRLSLRKTLGGLLSTAHECKALCVLAIGMHLHGHHVCAHGPTVLTNPERSESTSFLVIQHVAMPYRS